MSFRARVAAAGMATAAAVILAAPLRARQTPAIDVSGLHDLAWRSVGPFHGGRTTAAAGIPGEHRIFYIGVDGGGVWKTTDAGTTWQSIFDGQDGGTIGAIAAAPSDPRMIYVGGTGGLFRSADAGATWTRLAFPAGNLVPAIVVSPDNSSVLLVAVMGHPYGANPERGVFRSTDGGRSFDRVLFLDENTGGAQVVADPTHPAIDYAVLEQSRLSPWDTLGSHGAGTGVFKSTDAGVSWHPIGQGLPTFATGGLEQIAVAAAPSNSSRLFAIVTARTGSGVYRSDDAGETWTPATGGAADGPDGAVDIAVDPANAAVIYTLGADLEQSTDAGRTFHIVRRAPATRLWIDPADSAVRIVAGDRGAAVTLNGGGTWSSTDNQPTADVAKLSLDDGFPYAICAANETSAAICLPDRGVGGAIGARDWRATGAGEGASIAPDPGDGDTIYSADQVGVAKFDRRTGSLEDVTPLHRADFRVTSLPPLVFAPPGRRVLYFGANTLWKLESGTEGWTESSPDLSRPNPAGVRTPRGAIDVIRPSWIDDRALWIGTDDGQIQVSGDRGTTWSNVTPAAALPWSRVTSIEASHFDVRTAYAAVNAIRLDDPRPHLLRTRDGGGTWVPIAHGLPDDAAVNAVVEDPFRRGLLFAGTDRSVYTSFDDGDSWQSLTLNLPATSVRDLAIKDDDLVIATRGRGIWVLDDYVPLRQITADIADAGAFLFRPATAWRLRPALWPHVPAADAGPAAPGPVNGVGIDYELGPNARGPVTIEIVDGPTGEVLRHYASDADAGVSAVPGFHRVIWDLRSTPAAFGDSAGASESSAGDGSRAARGMLVLPGVYQVRLAAGGLVMRQAVVVRLDPAIHTPEAELQQMFALAKSVNAAIVSAWRSRDAHAEGPARRDLDRAIAALDEVLDRVEQADGRPTPAIEAAANSAIRLAKAAVDAMK